MKRLFPLVLVLALFLSAACADPLPLLEDYSETVEVLYDENDPGRGSFTYSYRYPHADESAEGGEAVNSYYGYKVKDTRDFDIPITADAYLGENVFAKLTITYTVTCSNDDYFSVLIHRATEAGEGESADVWEGNVFSRRGGSTGLTCTLPQLLGILATDENDTWLQDRQTEKAETLVRGIVWERIQENPDGIDFDPGFVREDLDHYFFPEQDFYLDENGDPVFFLQAGIAAPESVGIISFPIPLEDIKDEL